VGQAQKNDNKTPNWFIICLLYNKFEFAGIFISKLKNYTVFRDILSICQLHILLSRTAQMYLELHFCVELYTKKALQRHANWCRTMSLHTIVYTRKKLDPNVYVICRHWRKQNTKTHTKIWLHVHSAAAWTKAIIYNWNNHSNDEEQLTPYCHIKKHLQSQQSTLSKY